MKNWWLISSLIFLFLFKVLPISGQNLVNNGGFETTISCPTNEGQIYKANNWFSPSLGSPDLIARCSTKPELTVPNNYFGSQFPYDGDNYAHFLVENDHLHEYLTFDLNQYLISGIQYEIVFRVSLAENSHRCMDRLGVFFSETKPFYNTGSRIEVTPRFTSQKGMLLCDTTNWVEIRDTMVALGNERFITIGQFFAKR